MPLHTESKTALNISSGGIVLTYTYTGATPRVASCRVTVGSLAEPIAGGDTYTVRVKLNDIPVSPSSNIAVEAGVSRTVLISREFTIETNDKIEVSVDGLSGDTAIDTAAELLDMTPLTKAEVLGGGPIAVDHNYGGTNVLAYQTQMGSGIERATVQAFLQSDYDAGRRSIQYVRGETTTLSGGHWLAPLMLDPGDYTILYFRQGLYGPDTRAVTVTA